MQATINLSAFVMLALVIHTNCQSTRNSINCYQCIVNSNTHCAAESLKECPDKQAYDRCTTTVKKSAATGLQIIRGCGLGPCTLRDPKASGTLGFESDCDRSGPEYNCFYCCQGDGCNKDGAQSTRIPLLHIAFALITLFVTVL